MNRKVKKTFAKLGSRAVLARGAAGLAVAVIGALVRRKLRYRRAAHLADEPVENHLNAPGLADANPA